VSAATTRDRSTLIAHVCSGFRLVQHQGYRAARDQQRGRDHDQQQVLDHVVPEQHVIVAAHTALGGQHNDQ